MKLVAVEYYVNRIKYNYYTIVCEKDGIYFIASYRMTNNGGLKYVASIEGDVFWYFMLLFSWRGCLFWRKWIYATKTKGFRNTQTIITILWTSI